MMAVENLQLAVPVIGTAEVAKTVAWYEKRLGFQKQWTWGEPDVYAGIQAGGAMLYICHDPEMAKAIVDHGLKPDVFLWVQGDGQGLRTTPKQRRRSSTGTRRAPVGCTAICRPGSERIPAQDFRGRRRVMLLHRHELMVGAIELHVLIHPRCEIEAMLG